MGFRFRKSFKVAPGVRVNFGKKSTGISIGGKGGRISFNSKSGARVSTSIPGTGISYSTKLGGTSSHSNSSKRKASSAATQKASLSPRSIYNVPKQPVPRRGWYIVLAVLFIISGICYLATEISTAVITSLIGVIMFCFTYITKPIPKIDYVQFNRQLQIFDDSLGAIMTTIDPQTFFSKYKDIEQSAKRMAEITTEPLIHDGTPQEAIEMLENDKAMATNAFLDRMAAEIRQKAFSLTRGRKQKLESFKLLTLDYEKEMPPESIQYRDQLYQKMLDDLNSVEA